MVFFDVNSRAFRFYKAYLKFCEFLFLDRRLLRSNIVFSIMTLAQVTIVLMCLIHPVENCLPAEYHRANNDLIVCTICGVLTQIGLWVYNRPIVNLVESTTEDTSVIEEPEEQSIIERHNRHWAFMFYGVTLTPLGISIMFAWANRPVRVIKKFILRNRRETCEFTDDEIWLNLLQILSLISLVLDMQAFSTVHLFFWKIAMHLSAEFKILKEQFHNFLSIRDKKVSRKEFRRLVDRHNQLLDLSRHLEDSFAFVVAFQIFLHQVSLCAQTFRLFTTVDVFSMGTFLRLLICLPGALKIATFYYAGDYLTACSEEIGDVFTQCNWYDLSKESITDLSIVISRCQKPVKLTAAKMYKLNLTNLKHVFDALYSYMACIVTVVKARRE